MSRAIAGFCEHDVMWGAHVVKHDDAQEIIRASQFLDPGPADYLRVVDSEEVRVSLAMCEACVRKQAATFTEQTALELS